MPFKSTYGEKKNTCRTYTTMFIIFPSLLPSRLVCHPSASADPESSQVHMDNRKMGTERFLQLLSFLQLFNHFGFFSGNNFKALIQDLRYLEGG